MEALLELGLLVHLVLATFSGTAVVLTVLAIVRSPQSDAGTAGRPAVRSRSGEPGLRLVASATTNG